MPVEDQIPDSFKRHTFHPNAFIYAWKKKNLERLFDELQKSNIGIKRGEVWLVEEELVTKTIPLKNGEIKLFEWKFEYEKDEEWYDFVERTTKDSLSWINYWDLEKNVRLGFEDKLWYNFVFIDSF